MAAVHFLLHHAKEHPASVAIIFGETTFSYEQFLNETLARGHHFQSRGVKPGSKVILYSDNDFIVFSSLFALWHLGAIAVPMNPTLTQDILLRMEEIISPDIGFTTLDCVMEWPHPFPFHRFGETAEAPNLVSREYHEGCEENALGIILFTSGTSGVPKAVPITHKALAHNAVETAKCLNLTSSDRLLINTPSYTTSSIIHLLTLFSVGGSLTVDRGFLFGEVLAERLEVFQCTGFGGVPVHFSRLVTYGKTHPRPGRLRFLMNSGEHIPVTTLTQLQTIWPDVEIFCVYGLTEVAGRLCVLPSECLPEKTGSVGRPIDGMSVSIRDEEGAILPSNQIGQVYVKGVCLMPGYYNGEGENQRVLTDAGFATGDYGYLDDDKFLFLKGRKDDMFKVGGEKVSRYLIEEYILEYDEFKEFSVVIIFDPNMGNVPCLHYVLRAGSIFDQTALLKFLRKRLPRTHLPVYFKKVKVISRTSSGKVARVQKFGTSGDTQ